jgi:hypothetical protein
MTATELGLFDGIAGCANQFHVDAGTISAA